MPQQQQQRTQPSQSPKATIFIHPLTEGPLELRLPSSVVRLLRTLDILQRRQAGEVIVPTSDDAPALSALEKLSPGEVEASIAGGVAQVLECLWLRREEVVRVSAQEKWALLKVRESAERDVERRPADERQREVARQLQALINPHWERERAEAKAGKGAGE